MPHYDCIVTETLGSSWAYPGTTKKKYSYDGKVNMDGYKDSMVDSTRSWSCTKSSK